jgi:hypothetical protein
MQTLAILGAVLASMGTPHHHRRQYWWPAHVDCVITDGQRRDGSLNATPYIVCKSYPDQFKPVTPPADILNPSDNVNAPPDTTYGTAPCDYEPIPCS